MATYEGYCKIECPLECEVPEGYRLTEVPVPRHNWGDVKVCPNEAGVDFPEGQECGKAWLVSET
jgi:hypothetical protein